MWIYDIHFISTTSNQPIFPQYTLGERHVDLWVHVVGVTASVAAATALMWIAVSDLEGLSIASLAIYGSGLIAVFSCSASYHLMARPGWKETARRLDHAAIYVMIAGTYTPFALVKIEGTWGVALFAVVWAVAAAGVLWKLFLPRRFEAAAFVLYLVQGWAVLVALEPLFSAVSFSAFILLAIGGALYTLGVVFHLWRRLPYHNAIWHIFVLTAAACHYAAVLDAVALAKG